MCFYIQFSYIQNANKTKNQESRYRVYNGSDLDAEDGFVCHIYTYLTKNSDYIMLYLLCHVVVLGLSHFFVDQIW